ncbi:permease protein [Alicycliphilus sp. B1]|nr:permease protein [Alicycliphilus sp. B1]
MLFLACLFIAPLAGVVPAYATGAGAVLRRLPDAARAHRARTGTIPTEIVPAAVTALMMPFTYSIANGLAFGFITYAAVKLFTGRVREAHPMVWIIAGVFLFKFFYIGGH